MKIVDVCAFYTPKGGGVKTYIERKLNAAPKMGHDITVIAPGAEDGMEERCPNARIITLKAPKMPLDANYHYFEKDVTALHAALTAAQPDLIEASSPWRSPSQVARWKGHAPRVLIMHSDPLSAYAYRWFGRIAKRPTIDRAFDRFWKHLRRLDKQYDSIICANADLAGRLIDGGLTKVTVNAMGVEKNIFTPTLRSEECRAALLAHCGLPPSATLLLGVGRFAPEKRWPMVMSGVAEASAHHPIGLVLLGDGRDRAKIERRAKRHKHIHLMAPELNRTALATILASGDALVHGCEGETFGMVGAEARASGLPLIAPDQGGMADQGRGAGSELYTACDSSSLAQAIRRFIESDPVQRRAIATTEAPFVRTMDKHFEDLFAHYEILLQSGHHGKGKH